MSRRDGDEESAQRATEALLQRLQGLGAIMGGGAAGHNFVNGSAQQRPPPEALDSIDRFLQALQGNEGSFDLRDIFGGLAGIHDGLAGLAGLAATQEGAPPPGASRETINAIEEVDASEADEIECPVCLEHFQAGERLKRMPCKHAFHRECLAPWLERRATCPTCRHALPEEQPPARPLFDFPRAPPPAPRPPPPPAPPATEDLNALPVRELKRRLDALGVDYRGVVERGELVALLRERGGGDAATATSAGASTRAAHDDRELRRGIDAPSARAGPGGGHRGAPGDGAAPFSLASLMRMAAESQVAAEEERMLQEALRRSMNEQ
mmetsp:Transcript_25062/g.64724  ORF Transcript_25062/g.64724 Transcript_25062/m.64724 type:complete len:324 (+) Transcript_25062:46-1017(+)